MRSVCIGICVLVAFEVAALGGEPSWAQAVLEIGAPALFGLWGVQQIRRRRAEIYWNWLYLPLLGLCALGIVQCTSAITAYPYLTRLELLGWAADLMLFFLAVQSFRALEQAKLFVWFLVTFGFAVSFLAITQHFTSSGKLYWSISLPGASSAFGPYLSRDHFAGFVELTAPLGLALLLFRACRREHATLLFLFTVVPLTAAVLAASRGGILGLLFEFVLLLFLSRARHTARRQAVVAVALVLVSGAFLGWLGMSETIQRFELLRPGQISRDLRVSMFRDTWHIFLDHPWIGAGLGTLRTVYPRYASFYMPNVVVNHAHNDYLELLADAGLAGGLCGLAFLVLPFRQALKNLQAAEGRQRRAVVAGSLTACAGLLVHSLVDFNLHIPANAMLFLLLACLATSEIPTSHPEPALELERRSTPANRALARTAARISARSTCQSNTP